MAVKMNHDVIPGTLYFNLITIFTNQSYYECSITICLLVHLSRRLTDELIGQVGIRRTSSLYTIFKHLLLRNHLATQSQISLHMELLCDRGTKVCQMVQVT